MIRIRQLRKEKGITQKELADILKVSDSALSFWEQGKYEPDNKSLATLASYFGVTIDYLLGRTHNPKVQIIPADPGTEDMFADAADTVTRLNKYATDMAKFALFGGDSEVTDEMWEEAQQMAQFIKYRHQKAQEDKND